MGFYPVWRVVFVSIFNLFPAAHSFSSAIALLRRHTQQRACGSESTASTHANLWPVFHVRRYSEPSNGRFLNADPGLALLSTCKWLSELCSWRNAFTSPRYCNACRTLRKARRLNPGVRGAGYTAVLAAVYVPVRCFNVRTDAS
ncbi:hypothetical protein K523DRAFT_57665 [Schizophyllum commune Tattone D]|nr:hypothetical protein K523DRAFT_57665 [Schizophyllum commune Tattone D]